ncbi:MAG: hypothetical protein E5V37_04775 [Mesorhizobium sp.]|nr:hypothetical protein EOA37_15030 [Mesorhizobium sp. M2A.F.Ca.ET.015.02.1.1]RVC97951.1 hypothetical protein EN739_02525 [Mesorhizobium sp. M2A.F.Ca.ET.017.03.2.1]RVD08016.1 hypothetical protein EN753_15790 [Mesorhizobium sp. M2A.F.Ca.ET.029.05.1.1]RWB40712.1 MAG: hypothetical protein EOQ46_24300 [Mesorhizobium sp.]RWB62788.1 MAG: hypothetical protein EOQ48_11285 [Mesorhizobium sp.]
MRDLYSDIAFNVSLAPAARTASANGTGVDMGSAGGATMVVVAGAWTDGTHTFDLQESDDNSTFTSVPAALLIGSKPVISSAPGGGTSYKTGYLGIKRYLRAAVTVAGATTGAVYDALIVRGLPGTKPII